eukprot:3003269-Amphidinium_carterae.1
MRHTSRASVKEALHCTKPLQYGACISHTHTHTNEVTHNNGKRDDIAVVLKQAKRSEKTFAKRGRLNMAMLIQDRPLQLRSHSQP